MSRNGPGQGEKIYKGAHRFANHDDILDLAKLLLEGELMGLPAVGWMEDNEFEFDFTEIQPERSQTRDLQAKWAMLGGATELEHFSDRDFQCEKKKAIVRGGFLFQNYEVGMWYFELLEMVRKLLLTSIITFLYPGTPSQLAAAIVISLIFLIIFMQSKPFLDPELDFLQMSSLVAQQCTLLYGLMLIMQKNLEESGQERESKIVGWVVTLLNLICIIWPFVKYLARLQKTLNTIKTKLKRLPCCKRKRVPAEEEDGEGGPGDPANTGASTATPGKTTGANAQDLEEGTGANAQDLEEGGISGQSPDSDWDSDSSYFSDEDELQYAPREPVETAECAVQTDDKDITLASKETESLVKTGPDLAREINLFDVAVGGVSLTPRGERQIPKHFGPPLPFMDDGRGFAGGGLSPAAVVPAQTPRRRPRSPGPWRRPAPKAAPEVTPQRHHLVANIVFPTVPDQNQPEVLENPGDGGVTVYNSSFQHDGGSSGSHESVPERTFYSFEA